MLDVPAHIDLSFEDGTPVAVNGIAMSLAELNESIVTIAAGHGLDMIAGARAVAESLADLVVGRAREALTGETQRTGIVRVRLHHGEQTIESVSPTPLAHNS